MALLSISQCPAVQIMILPGSKSALCCRVECEASTLQLLKHVPELSLRVQGCNLGLAQGSLHLHDLGVHLCSGFLSLVGAGLLAGRRCNEGLELLRSVLAHRASLQ
eukprot:2387114-Rhodomonas_salina.2